MKENKKLYAIAIAGSVICFAGDVLLGAFAPAGDFGSSLLCIDFSHDWAYVDPLRFALAGFCGTVALIMMFFGFLGIYLRMMERKLRGAGAFLFSAFLFTAAGTLYHNVFAIAAYVYNMLSYEGYRLAQETALELFDVFIAAASPAAVGYAVMAVMIFVAAFKGKLFGRRWMCVINPALIMALCIALSRLLPRTAAVNGVFGFGQQSIGFLILFSAMCLTCGHDPAQDTQG